MQLKMNPTLTRSWFSGVRVKFDGQAEVEWSESESYYDSVEKKQKSRTVYYRSEQTYFHNVYNLVSGDNLTLPAGRHTYPFSFILPQQLPSSFEGKHGHIRYTITATVDRPWKSDYEAKVMIPLTSPLDLNFLPGIRVCSPISVSLYKVSQTGFVYGKPVKR